MKLTEAVTMLCDATSSEGRSQRTVDELVAGWATWWITLEEIGMWRRLPW